MNDLLGQPQSALAVIETTDFAVVFVPGGVEAIIQRIEREAREQAAGFDISTPRGRAEYGSLGLKIAKSKTLLDSAGKQLNEEANAKINRINAERRVARDRLDALKAEILKPRDDYEAAEEARRQANEAAITRMEMLLNDIDELHSEDIGSRMESIPTFNWSPEYQIKAGKIRAGVVAQLEVAQRKALERESAQEAERVRLVEEAERQRAADLKAQIAREERIAAEAAERARVEVEERAAAVLRAEQETAEAARISAAREAQRLLDEATERERKAAAELERVEAERLAGIERERLAEEQRIASLKQRIEDIKESPEWGSNEGSRDIKRRIAYLQNIRQADFDDLSDEAHKVRTEELLRAEQFFADAEAREDVAARRVEADRIAHEAELAEATRETERKRVAAEAQQQRQEDEKRALNVAHARKVNREARDAIEEAMNSVEGSGSDMQVIRATAVVEAIVKGLVPHTKINY